MSIVKPVRPSIEWSCSIALLDVFAKRQSTTVYCMNGCFDNRGYVGHMTPDIHTSNIVKKIKQNQPQASKPSFYQTGVNRRREQGRDEKMLGDHRQDGSVTVGGIGNLAR